MTKILQFINNVLHLYLILSSMQSTIKTNIHHQYFHRVISIITLCLFSLNILGQISHGGRPLPLSYTQISKSSSQKDNFFIEMPSFDHQEDVLRSQQDYNRFKSLEFAHKFDVHLRPDNSGITFIHNDMNVWRIGIRSKGAFSINILFSKFKLPDGARVYVYNTDQSQILGSYTSENNTDLNILPVQPIAGDELVVEYQVPLTKVDEGEIEIGEINHDFIGIFRALEPREPVQDCHPNINCYPENIQAGSGVVSLIIDGKVFCTGSLVNNSSNNGTPYLLTATHCLNYDFNPKMIGDRSQYDIIAGSIVAFFNYNSPSCETDIRGPIQMSVASADSVLISEKHDISLLKLKDIPPKEYQPYYLGWNSETSPSAPFDGIHHPNGGVKKIAIENDNITIGSFSVPKYNMEPNAHWVVKAWDEGATEQGSSGSPLVDSKKRIIGTLTGGESYCSSPKGPDVYAALSKFWMVEGSLNNPNPISHYLDPTNSGTRSINGLNPYADQPFTKSHNFSLDETASETFFESVPMFKTNNRYGFTEFAEEFYTDKLTPLAGVFVASSPTENFSLTNVILSVYTGENGPSVKLFETPLDNSFMYYSNSSTNLGNRNMKHNVENYTSFSSPVYVSGKFYISVRDINNIPNGFSVLNAEPRKIGANMHSTAWIKNPQGWINTSDNIVNPLNTSLYISPYVIGSTKTNVLKDKVKTNISVYHSNELKRIFIESNDDILEWQIFSVTGQIINHEKAEMSMTRTSISSVGLPKGVYIAKVKTIDGTEVAKKVLVN
jgi:lysyl endopeptidase